MTDQDHIELIESIKKLKGKVIICGYENELYDARLTTWKKMTKDVQASGNRGGVTRKECLWISPSAQQYDLFGASYEYN